MQQCQVNRTKHPCVVFRNPESSPTKARQKDQTVEGGGQTESLALGHKFVAHFSEVKTSNFFQPQMLTGSLES